MPTASAGSGSEGSRGSSSSADQQDAGSAPGALQLRHTRLVTSTIDHDPYSTRHSLAADSCDESSLVRGVADSDRAGIRRRTLVANVDIIAAGRDAKASRVPERDITAPGGVVVERINPVSSVEVAGSIAE